MNPQDIDYTLIGKACQYLNDETLFSYVEAPWIVSRGVASLTCPHDHPVMLADKTCPVGSAEQGLIDLLVKGQLDINVSLYAVGPCFRDDEIDELHQRTFMKIELFKTMSVSTFTPDDVHYVRKTAFRLWQRLFPATHHLYSMRTDTTGENAYDLMINGIEVGSYGVRFIGNQACVYGTALALPRATIALSRGL